MYFDDLHDLADDRPNDRPELSSPIHVQAALCAASWILLSGALMGIYVGCGGLPRRAIGYRADDVKLPLADVKAPFGSPAKSRIHRQNLLVIPLDGSGVRAASEFLAGEPG